MKAVGSVQEINLYPVKSMRGVSVPEAELYWYGLNGDRKYAFVRSDTPSGFPWLTGRESSDEGGEPEKAWLGASLTFGKREDSARVSVSYPIKRCVMVNLEPDTGQNNPEILKTVAEKMEACAGVYGVVSRLGTVRLGDSVYLEHHA